MGGRRYLVSEVRQCRLIPVDRTGLFGNRRIPLAGGKEAENEVLVISVTLQAFELAASPLANSYV